MRLFGALLIAVALVVAVDAGTELESQLPQILSVLRGSSNKVQGLGESYTMVTTAVKTDVNGKEHPMGGFTSVFDGSGPELRVRRTHYGMMTNTRAGSKIVDGTMVSYFDSATKTRKHFKFDNLQSSCSAVEDKTYYGSMRPEDPLFFARHTQCNPITPDDKGFLHTECKCQVPEPHAADWNSSAFVANCNSVSMHIHVDQGGSAQPLSFTFHMEDGSSESHTVAYFGHNVHETDFQEPEICH